MTCKQLIEDDTLYVHKPKNRKVAVVHWLKRLLPMGPRKSTSRRPCEASQQRRPVSAIDIAFDDAGFLGGK